MAFNRSHDLFDPSDEETLAPSVSTIEVDDRRQNRLNRTIVLSEDDLTLDAEMPDYDETDSGEDVDFGLPQRQTRSNRPNANARRQENQRQIGRYGYELDSFVDDESRLLSSDDFELGSSESESSASSVPEISEDNLRQLRSRIIRNDNQGESSLRIRRDQNVRNEGNSNANYLSLMGTNNVVVNHSSRHNQNQSGPFRVQVRIQSNRSAPYTRTRRGQVQNRSNAGNSNRLYPSLLEFNDFGNESEEDEVEEDDGWLSSRNRRNRTGHFHRQTRAQNTNRQTPDEELARRQQEQLDYELALALSNADQEPSPSRRSEIIELSSQSRRPIFDMSQPSSSRSQPAASSNAVLSTSFGDIRCVICFDDEPTEPVACIYCQNLIGCHGCVKKWFRTTNISRLNRNSPLSTGISNTNHRACPLCRAEWDGGSPEVMSYKEVLESRKNRT